MKATWEIAQERIAVADPHYGMSPEQHKRLFDYACTVPKGGTILELGVCRGQTAILFAYVAKANWLEYYGIDDFSLEGSKEEVERHLRSLGLDGTIIQSRTQDAAWDKPVDLLFIDAGHDEANIKPDCEKYLPFVKPGGLAIFDDWPPTPEKRVDNPHWAVAHYGALHTEGWEDLGELIADDQGAGFYLLRTFRKPLA